MNVLIVADGDVTVADVTTGDFAAGDRQTGLVIAADGGARKAELAGLRPDVVVGDFDSLAPATVAELRSEGVEIVEHPRAKDQSDTELAIREALARGATRLRICGALGGVRVEHTLANLLLLALPELAGVEATIVDGDSTVRVIGHAGPDRAEIVGHPGDYISLLPISGSVSGVTTSGLAFALDGETLGQGPTRGLSNEMTAERATVETQSGRLAIVHTRRGAAHTTDD